MWPQRRRIEYALHMALDLTEPEEQHVVAVVLAADMHRASYALTALTFRANANSTSFPPRKSLFLFARTLSHVPSSSSSHIPLSSTPPTQTLMVQPNPLRACFFPPSEELPLSPNCVVSPMILSHTPPASPLKPFHLHPPFPSFLLTRKELPPSAHSIVSTIILSQIPSSFHIPLSSSSPP
ncbi:unnamed protein product [Closterium sp. NIES-64]|nr:unnamed protein product [Closterium sp. NIES-64]